MEHIKPEIVQRLKKSVQFFADFTEDELIAFLKMMNYEKYTDRQIVFNEFDPGNKIYIILSGTIEIGKRIGKVDGDMKYTTLAELSPGECFGEMGLIDEAPRSARAVATEYAYLLSISNEKLANISKNPKYVYFSFKLYRNFCTMLATRLRESNEKVVSMTPKIFGK